MIGSKVTFFLNRPSFLIFILVVDKALQVVDQYHTNITNLEHDILLKPKMSTVRKCTFRMFFFFMEGIKKKKNAQISRYVFFQCISCRVILFFTNGPLNRLKL